MAKLLATFFTDWDYQSDSHTYGSFHACAGGGTEKMTRSFPQVSIRRGDKDMILPSTPYVNYVDMSAYLSMKFLS